MKKILGKKKKNSKPGSVKPLGQRSKRETPEDPNGKRKVKEDPKSTPGKI